MDPIHIDAHTLKAWSVYKDRVGFVPDPMVLRAGEIFLNGTSGSEPLNRNDMAVWRALEANIGGLCDFFDILVTRDVIPLIQYGDTFDASTLATPLAELLPDRMCNVSIAYHVYQTVKAGALVNLAALDLTALGHVIGELYELDAFQYGWEPALSADHDDARLAAATAKLSELRDLQTTAARFLLGGLIFSGFAQASGTRHIIQPKRSRFYLAMTAVPDQAGSVREAEEEQIFRAAVERLKGGPARSWTSRTLPPVLPYLLGEKPAPRTVQELLDRAQQFRASRHGEAYAELARAVSGDGLEARRAEDLGAASQREALDLLKPYSKLVEEKSRSLELTLSSEAVGVPGASVSVPLRFPTWLRVWWNDNVPFGGLRKTLRRMWLDTASYQNLAGALRDIWARS